MKVLVASSLSPRRHGNGGELQVAHLLANLAEHHELRVVYVGNEGDPLPWPTVRLAPAREAGAGLRWRRLLGIATRTPWLVRQLKATGLHEAVEREVHAWRPDVVLVTNGPAAYLCEHLAGFPRILSTIDSWSLNEQALLAGTSGLERVYNTIVARRVRRFDRRTLPAFDVITTVAARDREWMHTLSPATDIEVITNGVDTTYFSRRGSSTSQPPAVVFHGVMSYPPNVLAAEFLVRQVMPLVWTTHPDAQLELVGRSPSDRVNALAADRVVVTGGVDDLRPHLEGATVAVYPLLSGTGVKNKVLEAAAMGCTIVATPAAIGDLELRHGEHCLLGADAQELASHIGAVLTHPRNDLGEAARRVISERHSWAAAGTALAAACERAVAHHGQ